MPQALGRHNISTFWSTKQYRAIKALEPSAATNTLPGTQARCKMDSHADTCVAGPNVRNDKYTGEGCDVTPHLNNYQPIHDMSIVNASTAYTNDQTGKTMVLQFNQVLWCNKNLARSQINPNQICIIQRSDRNNSELRHCWRQLPYPT